MNLEWPMKMTSYLEIFTSAWSMSLCYYIACRFMFPIWNNCFQSTYFVSNLKRLFSMSFFCFQYKEIVSNLKSYFQSNLFPMYVSNLHITVYTVCRIKWKWLTNPHHRGRIVFDCVCWSNKEDSMYLHYVLLHNICDELPYWKMQSSTFV